LPILAAQPRNSADNVNVAPDRNVGRSYRAITVTIALQKPKNRYRERQGRESTNCKEARLWQLGTCQIALPSRFDKHFLWGSIFSVPLLGCSRSHPFLVLRLFCVCAILLLTQGKKHSGEDSISPGESF